MSLRVLIADDHELARYAMRMLLGTLPELSDAVFEEAENGRDAVKMAHENSPDIVIMDITMPEMNGIEATRQIRRACPDTKVIILSMHNRRQYLRELVQIGISGYVLKTRAVHDIPEAVRSALADDVYYSSKVASLIAEDYTNIISGKDNKGGKQLSSRQREVLQLIAEGISTKDIALSLGVTPKAIEALRHRIMHKLEIDNVVGLTKYALQEGLTVLDF